MKERILQYKFELIVILVLIVSTFAISFGCVIVQNELNKIDMDNKICEMSNNIQFVTKQKMDEIEEQKRIEQEEEQARIDAQNQYYQSSYTESYDEPEEDYEIDNDYEYEGEYNDAKEWIAERESGGDYDAVSSSGKYIGRYQLSRDKLDGDWSPEHQEEVADAYVEDRYGSWENAKAHWEQYGWY